LKTGSTRAVQSLFRMPFTSFLKLAAGLSGWDWQASSSRTAQTSNNQRGLAKESRGKELDLIIFAYSHNRGKAGALLHVKQDSTNYHV
jgi:hypothetical protein